MIILESKRLLVRPLSIDEIFLYIESNNTLTDILGLLPGKRDISDGLVKSFQDHILGYLTSNPESVLFATIWIVINKKLNRITGHIHFKGKPDETGMIEIGYRTYEEFKGNGYTTEAANLMINWAFSNNEIKMINAFTKNENTASQKILIKCRFEILKRNKDEIEWIKKRIF